MRPTSVCFALIAILVFSFGAFANDKEKEASKNVRNTPAERTVRCLVPDANTAIAIAVAVWLPIYGEKQINSQRPFHAELKNNQWTVTGSLPHDAIGGVATAIISKIDGRIIEVYHGQ
jgi:hypothetical protein